MITSKIFKIGLVSATEISDKDIKTYLKNQQDIYGQIGFLLLESLRASYQISYGDSGGVLLENGSWTGLIGMLNRSEIDLAMFNFFESEDRNEAVHFVYPLSFVDFTFITRKPQYSPQILAIFSTVSSSAWIALIISMLVILFLLSSIFTRRKYGIRENFRLPVFDEFIRFRMP